MQASQQFFVVGFKPIVCHSQQSAMQCAGLLNNAVIKTFSSQKELDQFMQKFDSLIESRAAQPPPEKAPALEILPKTAEKIPGKESLSVSAIKEESSSSEFDRWLKDLDKTKTFLERKKSEELDSPKSPSSGKSKDIYYYYTVTSADLHRAKRFANNTEEFHMFFDGAAKGNPGPVRHLFS
jgi:hypothetical protein